MNKRLVGILAGVIVAVMGVAVAVPFFTRVAQSSRQQTDRDHLRRMWEGYLIYTTLGTGTPRSRGYRFWLSLFVGDPEDGTAPHVFFVAEDSGLLCSPNDPIADPANAKMYVRGVAWGQINARDMGPSCISYAGPRESVFAQPKSVAGKIVGATGSREGVGFYPGSAVIIRGNLTTEIVRFADPAQREPNWQSPEFEHIANLGVDLPMETRRWITWPYAAGQGITADDAPPIGQTQPQSQPATNATAHSHD